MLDEFDQLLKTQPVGQGAQGLSLFDDLLQTKPLSPDDVMTGYPKGKEPTGKSFLDKAAETLRRFRKHNLKVYLPDQMHLANM